MDDGAEAEPPSFLPRVAYSMLLLLGVIAFIGIGITGANYLNSIASAQGLDLQIRDVQFSDARPARARLQFSVHNDMSQSVRIEEYEAFLFLQGHLLTNTYAGIEPGANASDFRKSLFLARDLAPGQSLDLDLTLYVPPDQVERARGTLSAGTVTWSANVLLRVRFPNAGGSRLLRLNSRFPE